MVLKSGRSSNWYVNWRKVSNDVFLIDQLIGFVLDFIRDRVASGDFVQPETLFGVPEGASKLGILAQYAWAKGSKNFGRGSHVLAMGRGSVKQHGAPEDRFFVGMPRGTTVVLEDVTTTGGSLLTTIDSLAEAGVPIAAAIGLTNRMERRNDGKPVSYAIAEKRSRGAAVRYFHMSNALELLPAAARRSHPGPEVIKAIEEEFREFGVQPLRFG
jgi:orotate phosphoribosyltransferase